jgi:hypothetical protein
MIARPPTQTTGRPSLKVDDPEMPYVDQEKSIGERIAERMADLTPEEKALLPRDLSVNHDHYIYGTPKVVE